MAKRVLTTYVDDLDGSEIKAGKGGEVIFGFDGADFVIDLSAKNKRALEKALLPFLDKARPYRGPKRTAKIRAWAKQNGYDVPHRGRVSAEVRAAYQAAR